MTYDILQKLIKLSATIYFSFKLKHTFRFSNLQLITHGTKVRAGTHSPRIFIQFAPTAKPGKNF